MMLINNTIPSGMIKCCVCISFNNKNKTERKDKYRNQFLEEISLVCKEEKFRWF